MSTSAITTRCSAIFIAAVSFAALACGSGVTDTTPPPPGGGTDTTGTNPPPGTVQRASITVQASFDPEDAALAQTAGLGLGGLTVRLQRSGSTDAPKTATTDANGRATFEQLLQGTYVASIERTLSPTELSRLPVGDRDASVFAGGGQLVLAPPTSRTLAVAVVGARRGSLIISERFGYKHKSPSPAYPYGDYIEVYNNSDTTIYLDGVVLFRTTSFYHTDSWGPCSFSSNFREDPERVWANSIVIFPGDGRSYPILPGQGKVVAHDAVNHQHASGILQYTDLSLAHFEMYGNDADVDNPLAANMIRGFNATVGPQGRGPGFPDVSTWGLAVSQAVTGYVTDTLKEPATVGTGRAPLAGIRRTDILDLFSTTHSPAYRAFLNSINYGSHDCPNWLSPVFERGVALIDDNNIPDAIRRKSLGLTADGRTILQRTRTSARDLERGPPLRRSLNRPQ